jgi:DNA/RNA endonuclease G (NUC1)
MDLVLKQKAVLQAPDWWNWEVCLDGPDSVLDQIDSVEYLLHPTFSERSVRTVDRGSRFALRSSGWGEFMLYAEIRPRSGAPVHLRHWLRLQPESGGEGYAVLLVGSPGDESFTDDLQTRIEGLGFRVLRTVDEATIASAGVAVAVVSSAANPSLETDVAAFSAARKPLLVIGLDDGEAPACLAHYQCAADPDAKVRLAGAATWLGQILDRSQRTFTVGGQPSMASAFWNNRFALAISDIQRCAEAFYPLVVDGSVRGFALAIAPDLLIAPAENLQGQSCAVRLSTSDIEAQPLGPPKDVVALRLRVPVSTFVPLSSVPSDPVLAIVHPDADQSRKLSPGWLTAAPTYELFHDVAKAAQGSAILSLETGALLGIQIRQGRAIPANLIRDFLPPGTLVEAPAADALEAADVLERRSTEDDYVDRKGYDPKFLGFPVPLPKTSAEVTILKYTNFSVALHRKRQLSLYAVVNIDGKKSVSETRSGDPWQLDPRVPDDLQIGKRYYEGTPLDRGHMVRRIDPVWGKDFKQAELDTFHYPNSCPQHKNLNRKIWNDLEDYIYDHLKDDKQKVTVFTGPVLAKDDPVFRKKKLPREFWKVVVIRRPDGKPSATAYILSQTDMIRGLEFVYGEFRTYQVSLTLIEKKTGLDFGDLRKRDPKGKKQGPLESLPLPTEIRGPSDLEIEFDAPETAQSTAKVEGFAWNRFDFESQLNLTLESFDWKTTDELVDSLISRLGQGTSEFDPAFAQRTLARLQRKRRFAAMSRAGDAFLQAGFGAPQVRRRYAQALIEQGIYQAASLVLKAITVDVSAPPSEQEEAQGLLGRISKQIYVNLKQPGNPRNVAELQSAVDFYWLTYAVNPAINLWHGINVVACLRRAERDGVKLRVPSDPKQVAQQIVKTLARRETESQSGALAAWDQATYLEACLALDDHANALNRAKMYAFANDADAFEIAATLRQLEEVWQLRSGSSPGDSILPILRAALLKRSGGSLQLSPEAANRNLQKVFGSDKSVSLEWFQQGLRRAESVVRIESNGKGCGTGWLMDIGQLVPGKPSRVVLVTNAHVIGPDTSDRHPEALRPEDATVNFLMLNKRVPAGKVVFHSPVNQLDATFLELEQLPEKAEPLALETRVLTVNETTPQRLYMIGCPSGRNLEFSLQDNFLLAASDRLVHYRTPSEPGSSGSPVFGPTDWKVVALHHAGSREMPHLDGNGTYEANEGIALAALRLGTDI